MWGCTFIFMVRQNGLSVMLCYQEILWDRRWCKLIRALHREIFIMGVSSFSSPTRKSQFHRIEAPHSPCALPEIVSNVSMVPSTSILVFPLSSLMVPFKCRVWCHPGAYRQARPARAAAPAERTYTLHFPRDGRPRPTRSTECFWLTYLMAS